MPQSEFLKVALDAAKTAEATILKYYTDDTTRVELKPDGTPVTPGDKEAEQVIIETIQQHFPDHGFLGEESGASQTQSAYQWLIDPIDGTKNYVRKIPLFATQLALMKDNELILGVSNAPVLKEVMYAEKGSGAFLNDRPIHVTDVNQLSDAVVCHAGLESFTEQGLLSNICDLINDSSWSRGFGDFYMYHLLASGRVDVVVEAAIYVWDIAALTVIIREAGGAVTDLQGRPINTNTTSIVATNGALHEAVLEYF
jgi:histidinol-phosphatase